MIVVDRPKLRFLLAGRAIDVDVSREYRKGRDYAVGVSPKRSVCRAQVVESQTLEGGGWRLTIKPLSGDRVRLFTRSGQYVEASVEANPDDPDVLRHADFYEPEGPSDAELAELAKFRAAAHQTRQHAPALDLMEQAVAVLDEALRTSVSRELARKIRGAQRILGKRP